MLAVQASEANRQALVKMLTPQGYDVHSERTGEAALAFLLGDAPALPDVVLIDTVLSDMSGYELCARIRASFDRAELPVVLLGSAADRAAPPRSLGDADGIMYKVRGDQFTRRPGLSAAGRPAPRGLRA